MYSSIASPSAPLCVASATRPRGGKIGANDAFSPTRGSVFIRPMQFGPIRRAPAARTFSNIARSDARPSSLVSPNPALITTSPRTPLARHSSTTCATCAAGTAMTATSTGARHVGNRAIRHDAVDVRRLRMDRIQRAGEARLPEIPEERAADVAGVAAGADHGDAARLEQELHRCGGRLLVAIGAARIDGRA